MIKIFNLIFLAFSCSIAFAQTHFYNINEGDTYTEIQGGISITNNNNWDEGTVKIPIGFTFKYCGEFFDSVTVDYNGNLFFGEKTFYDSLETGDSLYVMKVYNENLNSITINTLESDISYKRLDTSLTIQFQDIGFVRDDTKTSFTNFQVSLYKSGTFKYHYGSNKLNGSEFELSGPQIGSVALFRDPDSEYSFFTIYGEVLYEGNNQASEYAEYYNDIPDPNLSFTIRPVDNFKTTEGLKYVNGPVRRSVPFFSNGDIQDGFEWTRSIIRSYTTYYNQFGVNQYRDKAVAEKYYFFDTINIQGFTIQLDFDTTGIFNDTIEFSLLSEIEREPGVALTGTKVALKDLKNNGLLNIIKFDSSVSVHDHVYIKVNLPQYTESTKFGMCFSRGFSEDFDPYKNFSRRIMVQTVFNEWISTRSTAFINRIIYASSETFNELRNNGGDYYFAMSPIFTYKGDNTDLIPTVVNRPTIINGSHDKLQRNKLSLYPTIAKEIITLNARGSYVIQNSHGNNMMNGNTILNQDINIENLTSGVYFLRFTDNSQTEYTSVKFVKL